MQSSEEQSGGQRAQISEEQAATLDVVLPEPVTGAPLQESPSVGRSVHGQRPQDPIVRMRNGILRVFHYVESAFDALLTPAGNPFYFLGAIPILLLIVLLFTGLYLFIYYSMAVDTTHDSIKYLTERAVGGRFMRSLHRYAADGMMFFVILHVIRVFAQGRYQTYRRQAWWIGVLILVLMMIQGVVGYMMPLDSTSRFVMEKTAEFLAFPGIFGNTLPRSFSSTSLMGKWIMWVILIIHLAIPLSFVFLLFVHLKRTTRPKLLPPTPVSMGITLALVVFALAFPVRMLARSDEGQIPFLASMDWFYLFFAPWLSTDSYAVVWFAFIGFVLILVGAPWLGRAPAVSPAHLELSQCTGCTLCSRDCPYEAIRMQPRTDGKRFKLEAVVDTDICSGCGICVGSCDFEGMHFEHLRLPEISRRMTESLSVRPETRGGWYAVVCEPLRSRLPRLVDGSIDGLPGVSIMEDIPCVGAIGPRFTEQVRDRGGRGLLIGACPSGDCHYREGNTWVAARILNRRKPGFRRLATSFPIVMLESNTSDTSAFLAEARGSMAAMKDGPPVPGEPPRRRLGRVSGRGRFATVSIPLLATSLLAWLFYLGAASNLGSVTGPEQHALLRIDFFRLTEHRSCDLDKIPRDRYEAALKQKTSNISFENLSPDAQARIKASLRESLKEQFCSRDRLPLRVSVDADGARLVQRTFRPVGIQDDGLTYARMKVPIAVGRHKLTVRAEQLDGARVAKVDELTLDRELEGGHIYFVDYDRARGQFFLRTAGPTAGKASKGVTP